MRDKNRIDDFLARLKKVWKSNPDLRFTQLIGNVLDFKQPLAYYVEDETMISQIEKVYGAEKADD